MNKKIFSILAFVVVGIFLLVNPASAGFGSWAAGILASLLSVIINAIASIIGLVIQVFIELAQYNGFINAPAVKRGWVVVRDVSNMFFVLILLLISFATILKIEAYNYKKHLPKLVLMAVLINFSKTICGLFIDFSQVIMLTFVNGFKNIGEGSLVHMLGLKEIFSIQENAGDVDFWSIAGAYFLGLLYVIIALVIVVAMTVALVMRIVMLWIYVILSPLAFLLSAFPGGQSYSQQWWSRFSKELITGPVLAFFVWLAFVSATYTSSGSEMLNGPNSAADSSKSEKQLAAGISEAATSDILLRFIVSIGMLIGGMMIAQQMGGSMGQMAGKGMGALQSGQRAIGNAGKRKMQKLGESAKYGKDRLVAKASSATGIQLSSSQRALAKKERREGMLRGDRVAADKSIASKAEKGGVMGNLALASSGHKGAFQMLRFGQAQRTKQAFKAKQEIAGTQERISHIQDEKNTRESKEQKISQLGAREIQAGNRISEIDKEIDSGLKSGKLTVGSDELKNLRAEQEDQKKIQSESGAQKKVLENDLENNKPSYTEGELSSLESRKKAAEDTLEKAQSKSTINMGNQKRSAQNEQDRKANESIAHIDNASELVQAVKDGMRSGNQSQVRVAAKKLAKNGDYNALNKSLNLGSGQKGMIDLAKILQEKGSFSQQDSLSLVSDIGGLAKNNGQLSPYGVVTMENGMWRESNKTEKEVASYRSLSSSSMENIMRRSGASALGSYSDPDNSVNNWQIDSSAVAMLQGNQQQFIDALNKFGNPEIVSHLSTEANVKILQDNGLDDIANTVQRMASQRQNRNSADNIEDMVRNIVINP